MKPLDFIFLDLDGPVLDGRMRHYQCYCNILKKYGGIPVELDEYWDMKRSKTSRTVLLEKSKFQGTYSEYLDQWMNWIERKEYLRFDQIKPAVLDTLTSWKAVTDTLYLVTMRNHSDNLYWQLNEIGLLKCFDKIICCSSKGENPKHNVLKDIKFHHAIMIGDTEEDTKTATLLGIKSIGITNGIRKGSLIDSDYQYNEICEINWDYVLS